MAEKKPAEMNFKEFVENAKMKNNPTIDAFEIDVISRMNSEGFSTEEIYNMPIPKFYDLYLQVLGNYLEDTFANMAPIIDADPKLADHPTIKTLSKDLRDLLERLEKGKDPP
jgi:hypothetical protein